MSTVDTVAVPSSEQAASAELARHAFFLVLLSGTVAWFWKPLATVIGLSLHYGNEQYSHIVAVPFMALFLLWVDRRNSRS